ncbi:cytosine deaminase, partial [Photobacterium damselae]
LVLPAENGFDAVRRQVPVRYSIRSGRIIAQTQPAKTEICLDKTENISFKH